MCLEFNDSYYFYYEFYNEFFDDWSSDILRTI